VGADSDEVGELLADALRDARDHVVVAHAPEV
jgi:hypothetical protein